MKCLDLTRKKFSCRKSWLSLSGGFLKPTWEVDGGKLDLIICTLSWLLTLETMIRKFPTGYVLMMRDRGREEFKDVTWLEAAKMQKDGEKLCLTDYMCQWLNMSLLPYVWFAHIDDWLIIYLRVFTYSTPLILMTCSCKNDASIVGWSNTFQIWEPENEFAPA